MPTPEGGSCGLLADALCQGKALRAEGDIAAACVENRIGLLVSARRRTLDLVSTLVPHDVDLASTRAVTAAVGPGPHSPLAAAVASRLGRVLDVPAEVVTVHDDDEEAEEARDRLVAVRFPHSNLEARLVQGTDVRQLVASLVPRTLLVVGAAGGSWLQRQLFGAGHRLLVSAPGGAIVARSTPERCFHRVEEAHSGVASPHLAISEARRLVVRAAVPVADHGVLVGVLRRSAVVEADAGGDVADELADVMEAPVAVHLTDDLAAASAVSRSLDGAPAPVIDHEGRLVGVVDAARFGPAA